MYYKSVMLLFAILTFTGVHAQLPVVKDSTVDVIAQWEKGETHNIKLKSSTREFTNSASHNTVSTYNVTFTVTEKSDSGYAIEWVYTTAAIDGTDPMVENQLIPGLTGVKIKVRLTDVGRFDRLINMDEVKTAANKKVDELIARHANNAEMSAQFTTIKQFMQTREGLEIVLLKPLKFYTYYFGYTYKLNVDDVSAGSFPNPLNGELFEAKEHVKLTQLDYGKSVCMFQSNKVSDATGLKNAVIAYFKKLQPEHAKEIDNELGNAQMELSEHTTQQIDFAKGIVLKFNYRRAMLMGFQNEVTTLEMETVD